MNESIEDLLQRATGKKKGTRVENDSRVLRYLEKTKMEPGLLKVPTYFIYWHYRQVYTYPGLYDQNKAKKVVFFRTFGKRFPQYRRNTQRFYLLDPLHLSEFVDKLEVNGEVIYKFKEDVLSKAKNYDKTYGQQKKKNKSVQLLRPEGDNES
jgi:hypothetical protein